MNIELKKYKEQIIEWPTNGHHIMAQYDTEKVIVYQSYRKEIGNFAVKNQYFGGAFSLNRMTWIKPNFLWMMYRNGWGTKTDQEVVLALHLKLSAFENYLQNAVYSSFDQTTEVTKEIWQDQVKTSSVRLQWDPDHDPNGAKLERRAIQIGLRNEFVQSFATKDILEIEDISEYVKEQYSFVQNNQLEKLETPLEKRLIFKDNELNKKLKLLNLT
jgi:Domain of unknown function (DUF4291)